MAEAEKRGLAILLGLKPREDGDADTAAEDNSIELRTAGQNLLDAIGRGGPEGAAQAVLDIKDLG